MLVSEFTSEASRIKSDRTHDSFSPITTPVTAGGEILDDLVSPLSVMAEDGAEPNCPVPELIRTLLAPVARSPPMPEDPAVAVSEHDGPHLFLE